jgi:hypothetical protein
MATKPPMDMKKAKADAKKRAVKRKAREASKSIPKVPKEVSKAIKDNASPDLRETMVKSTNFKSLVRFRDIDIDANLSKFIRRVTKRGSFKDETEATVAMLEYLAHFATKRGLGAFVPHVRAFRKKK